MAQTKSVLIVEDEADIRDLLRELLEYEGFQVSTASQGREALTLLENEPRPHAILLDLMMPVMNGWELARAVRERPDLSSIPIIVVSAFADKAAEIHPHAVVRKPIEMDDLISILRRCCGDA